jgi:VanZ family protein
VRVLQLAKPWLPAIAYMALIVLLSAQGRPPISFDHVPLRDKGVHLMEFAVLALLIAYALGSPVIAAGRIAERRARWKIALWTIALATIWGYLDEVHQAFVPGRTADAWDLVADFLGSIAGTAIYLALSQAIARKRHHI